MKRNLIVMKRNLTVMKRNLTVMSWKKPGFRGAG